MIPFRDYHLFQILRRFEGSSLPLDLFLSHYFREHKAIGSHDRREIAETVYGMTRWRGLLNHFAENDIEKHFALFKNLQSLKKSSLPSHIRVSFPKNLFNLFSAQYGEEKAIELCEINNTEAPVTIRVNRSKTSVEALLSAMSTYDPTPCTHSPLGMTFKKRLPFFEMKEFKEGHFEVQDEGSQLVAQLVEAKSGEQILDYCSGSGGKSLAFASNMQNKGQIYLHDVRKGALLQAKKRFLRAGVQNVQFLHEDHPQLSRLKKKMDWVLVDAPCSGTGTLRRNPDMKWRFTLESLENLVLEQRVIFESALSYLKPSGKIIYATCSALKQENEEQLAYFVKKHGLRVCGEPFFSIPSVGGMDGFYAVVLSEEPRHKVESCQSS